MTRVGLTALRVISLSAAACLSDDAPTAPLDPDPVPEDTLDIPLAGGLLTVFNTTSEAYDLPATTLLGERLQMHHNRRLGFESSTRRQTPSTRGSARCTTSRAVRAAMRGSPAHATSGCYGSAR
jgi:hypothetical protein